MTSYNGNSISYDDLGNRTSYNGWTYTWDGGRHLTGMTNTNGTTISYKYDENGIRTEKTVNGVTTKYTTIDGRITSQTDGTNSLYYRYDSNNELSGVQINGTDYIYVKNISGDVIATANTSGTIVVEYTYDAWGNVTSITGTLASTIGQLNPMRYRSYYYDTETGYYYLKSRYYESTMGRFINSDGANILALGKFYGNNMFAYGLNNPVNEVDTNGYSVTSALLNVVSSVLSIAFAINPATGGLKFWIAVAIGAASFAVTIYDYFKAVDKLNRELKSKKISQSTYNKYLTQDKHWLVVGAAVAIVTTVFTFLGWQRLKVVSAFMKNNFFASAINTIVSICVGHGFSTIMSVTDIVAFMNGNFSWV